VHTPEADIRRLLGALEIASEPAGADRLTCTIPAHRAGDLSREIDLIEEVVRARGLGVVPVPERLGVSVKPPQASERAARAIADVLTGQGFSETVTFSFTTPAHAKDFLQPGTRALAVDDTRRAADGTLRPSILPGLLACRRVNQDARVSAPGGVRLFETAAVFAEDAQTKATRERRTLALLLDVPGSGTKRTAEDRQQGLRLMRGVLDAVARACLGPGAPLTITEGTAPPCPAWEPGAWAAVVVPSGSASPAVQVGTFGLVSQSTLRAHGVDLPVVAAELDLAPLIAAYPPRAVARALPQFPGIERDVSLVMPEGVRWAQLDRLVGSLGLEGLEAHEMVGVFRGAQTGAGRKSVTVRLHFRDGTRTLRHEEVDPQVARLVEAARERLGAQIRA
jgi:phenylalanyl-tRNA synthetase beta chain